MIAVCEYIIGVNTGEEETLFKDNVGITTYGY